jgi:hypothetical protein
MALGKPEATKRRQQALDAEAGGGHQWRRLPAAAVLKGQRPGDMGEIDWVLPALGICFIGVRCGAAADLQ